MLVAQLGFEPRTEGYEPTVIPFHYRDTLILSHCNIENKN